MSFDTALLKKLTEAFGPSGREGDVESIVTEHLKSLKLAPKKDQNGNVSVTLGKGGKKIMLAAHMDEVGVMVSYIDEKGFLKISPVGFIYPEQLLGNRVLFDNGKWGVFSFEKTMPKVKVDMDSVFVDVGAKDRARAEKDFPVGTFGVFHRELTELEGGRMLAKAFDDRIGVYILIKTIEALKDRELKNTLHFTFTVQEEFSGLGAQTSGYAFAPDMAIAVDVTDSDDTREKVHLNMVLDGGPAVKVMDSSLISHPALKNYFIGVATEKKIPFQLEVLPFGGTDAGTLSLLHKGVPAICISIPTRYIHTPSEIISKDDVNNSVRLLEEALIGKIGEII